MNIFNSLRRYAGKWQVKESRNFLPEEKDAVTEAVVVSSQYGNSVCFIMVDGSQTYIPLSQNSTLGVGDDVDLDQAQLVTLCKSGEDDIYRVEL